MPTSDEILGDFHREVFLQIRNGASSSDLWDRLNNLKAQAIKKEEAVKELEKLHAEAASEDEEDIILELMDFTVGFAHLIDRCGSLAGNVP